MTSHGQLGINWNGSGPPLLGRSLKRRGRSAELVEDLFICFRTFILPVIPYVSQLRFYTSMIEMSLAEESEKKKVLIIFKMKRLVYLKYSSGIKKINE